MPCPSPPPYLPGIHPTTTPSHARLPARGVGPTGGRGVEGIHPEYNQEHPEVITSCLEALYGHAPSSRLELGSGRRGSATPLSGTSCQDTMPGISCLYPEDNKDHPEDITSRLDDTSGHAPSS